MSNSHFRYSKLLSVYLTHIRFFVLLTSFSLTVSNLVSIDVEKINPIKLPEIYQLPTTQHYQNYRIPLVFEKTKLREKDFQKKMTIKYNASKYKPTVVKSSEEFKKSKCSNKDFILIREIAYTYNPRTLISWESCEYLEVDIKRAKLDGRDNDIPLIISDRVDRWKKVLMEELEKVVIKPVPKLVNKLIDPSIKNLVEEYHKVLLNHLYDGIYTGIYVITESIVNLEIDEVYLWNNRVIDDFNKSVYNEKISLDEKKNLIENNMKAMKSLNLTYEYSYMFGEILDFYPAPSLQEENSIILGKIKEANDRIEKRLDIGNYPIQKKLLNHAISCLEQWSDWHKKNLRMAYYYGFYYEYGNFKGFSDDLKKDSYYWNIAKNVEERILDSEVFRYRLEVVVRDACMTAFKKNKEIESSY